MDRRSFLKALGAGLVALALPKAKLQESAIPPEMRAEWAAVPQYPQYLEPGVSHTSLWMLDNLGVTIHPGDSVATNATGDMERVWTVSAHEGHVWTCNPENI